MKSRLLIIAAAVAAIMGIAGCSTAKEVSVTDLSGRWDVTSINGTAVAPSETGDSVYIAFDTQNHSISGSTGCNRLLGSFTASENGGEIDLSGLGSTRMMCPDMTTEMRMLEALGQAKKFSFEKNGDLVLKSEADKAVMVLHKVN